MEYLWLKDLSIKDIKALYKNSDKILTLDIETSNYYIDNNKRIVKWDRTIRNQFNSDLEFDNYYKNMECGAICYVFQFSIGETVILGRELSDLTIILKALNYKKNKAIIWVHNLSFEFHFLINFLTPIPEQTFARQSHKPIKAVFEEFPYITFRCSYSLTNMSLDSVGKQVGIKKLSGQFDYNILKTPIDDLTPKEIEYCIHDCLIVHKLIEQELLVYKTQDNIPMTSTGKIRRITESVLSKDKDYQSKFRLMKPKVDMYKILRNYTFQGGYTHAAYLYANRTIRGNIEHYDFSSSYPAVICTEKFPMSPFISIDTDSEIYNEYGYCIKIELLNMKANYELSYISISKCLEYDKDTVIDNGRVLESSRVVTYITNIDLDIILKCYSCDFRILELYRTKEPLEYLPKSFIELCLELYSKKTSLKDVEGRENEYIVSKQHINALFGMCVTSIDNDSITYDNGEWYIESDNSLELAIDKIRNKTQKYFLPFEWGVFITAYARKNLWDVILQKPLLFMYGDTDSAFVNGHLDCNNYHKSLVSKIEAVCRTLNIDKALYYPKTPKGEIRLLGEFCKENNISEFRTLGAKRYAYRDEEGLHITVSGINKEAVAVLNDNIDNFTEDIEFPSSNENVKHSYIKYLDNKDRFDVFENGYINTNRFGICIRNTTYTIGLSDDYMSLLDIERIHKSLKKRA